MTTIIVPLSPKDWITKPRITAPTPARVVTLPEAVARGLDPDRPFQCYYDREQEAYIYQQEEPRNGAERR